jgi:(heptosyl)LPS beta-1,4-glucosyltransferase
VFPLSVVIITKNEASNIIDCIQSARQITDDIIIVDSGSTDDTLPLLHNQSVTLIQVAWKCFGASRNTGAIAAKNDWIFTLDADERISPDLAASLQDIDFASEKEVYRIRRRNFFAGQPFHFGTAGFDCPVRIYNRKHASWDLSPVHEELRHRSKKSRKIKGGCILHFSMKSIEHYKQKLTYYASLCAWKYCQKGNRATYIKRYLSPVFNSFKSYFLQLGFLDGRKGYQLAKLILFYSFLKYKYLRQLQKETGRHIELPLPIKASA